MLLNRLIWDERFTAVLVFFFPISVTGFSLYNEFLNLLLQHFVQLRFCAIDSDFRCIFTLFWQRTTHYEEKSLVNNSFFSCSMRPPWSVLHWISGLFQNRIFRHRFVYLQCQSDNLLKFIISNIYYITFQWTNHCSIFFVR